MDTLPTRLVVSLIGGPLDGDDALLPTPLPLYTLFRSGWDVEQAHREYPYMLRLNEQGKVFYVWVARTGRTA